MWNCRWKLILWQRFGGIYCPNLQARNSRTQFILPRLCHLRIRLSDVTSQKTTKCNAVNCLMHSISEVPKWWTTLTAGSWAVDGSTLLLGEANRLESRRGIGYADSLSRFLPVAPGKYRKAHSVLPQIIPRPLDLAFFEIRCSSSCVSRCQ